MANHQSAKKRSRQNFKRNQINRSILSNIKSHNNTFHAALTSKDQESIIKTLSLLNSSLATALKKGLLKKRYVSRKLSSLSHKIKKIA